MGLDLTGKRFGYLTVIERYKDETKRSKWKCICDCGNEVITRSDSLTSGNCKSCKKGVHAPRFVDLTGNRYGMLTVVKLNGFVDNTAYWECLCDCGNTTFVETSNLTFGNTKSCGCLRTQYNDLVGCNFGDLVVISRARINEKKVYYDCLCKCGNHIVSRADALTSGKTHSCGCSNQSLACDNITKILSENNISFSKEVCFSDLKSPKGSSLRYDFAILDENNQISRLIEYDGIQHTRAIKGWWGGKEGFDYRKECDLIKTEYAISHNIPLVRIPYTAGNNISLDDIFTDKYIDKIA